jgi:hypothetical protein
METENPSACATVDCKLCKSAIALYCLYLREIVNPIIRTRSCYFRHAYPPTSENIKRDYSDATSSH